VSELSQYGFVKMYKNFIYLVDKDDMNQVRKGIAMGYNGIQFFKYPGDEEGETYVATE
jgi:hypothetical protein